MTYHLFSFSQNLCLLLYSVRIAEPSQEALVLDEAISFLGRRNETNGRPLHQMCRWFTWFTVKSQGCFENLSNNCLFFFNYKGFAVFFLGSVCSRVFLMIFQGFHGKEWSEWALVFLKFLQAHRNDPLKKKLETKFNTSTTTTRARTRTKTKKRRRRRRGRTTTTLHVNPNLPTAKHCFAPGVSEQLVFFVALLFTAGLRCQQTS